MKAVILTLPQLILILSIGVVLFMYGRLTMESRKKKND